MLLMVSIQNVLKSLSGSLGNNFELFFRQLDIRISHICCCTIFLQSWYIPGGTHYSKWNEESNYYFTIPVFHSNFEIMYFFCLEIVVWKHYNSSFFLNISFNFFLIAGGGTPGPTVNGALPSLPSPTVPNFTIAQTPNGQPPASEPAIYTNGIHQTFPPREYTPDYFHLTCHELQALDGFNNYAEYMWIFFLFSGSVCS